eukprot:86396-Chlamydomonas_euryale.AAC.5
MHERGQDGAQSASMCRLRAARCDAGALRGGGVAARGDVHAAGRALAAGLRRSCGSPRSRFRFRLATFF